MLGPLLMASREYSSRSISGDFLPCFFEKISPNGVVSAKVSSCTLDREIRLSEIPEAMRTYYDAEVPLTPVARSARDVIY